MKRVKHTKVFENYTNGNTYVLYIDVTYKTSKKNWKNVSKQD